MVHKKIFRVFLENPNKDFHIRGIAAKLGIPKTTVSYHIHNLLNTGLIVKETKGVFPSFRANSTNPKYLFYKKQESVERMIDSGIIDYLEDETNPKCIILFGSFSKGEYDKNSDIDLFIQAQDIVLDLSSYERKLGHTINILFEPILENLSNELLNNVINGIKLRGFIKLK